MAAEKYKQVKNIIAEVVKLKSEQKFSQARKVLEEGLQKFPDNDFLKVSLADLFVRINRLQEAEELAGELLAAEPTNYRAIMVRGDTFYRKRDYEQALSLYRQAYGIKETPFIASKLIKSHMRLEEYEQALSLCQEWNERKPENRYFKKLKAAVYEKMDKIGDAEEVYRQYLRDEPEDDFAYKENIKLKIKDKEPVEAVRELRRLLKTGQRSDNVHLYTLLAGELEKLGEYEEAVSAYKEALSKNPGDNFILKQLGFCLTDMEQEEEAINYLEQAFREDPGDYYIRSSLFSLYKKSGKIEEGIDFFREIIRENPAFKNLWGIVKKLSKELQDNDD